MRMIIATLAATVCFAGPATACNYTALSIAERAACTPDNYDVVNVYWRGSQPWLLSYDWYCQLPARTGIGMVALCAHDGETPWVSIMDVTKDTVSNGADRQDSTPLAPCR